MKCQRLAFRHASIASRSQVGRQRFTTVNWRLNVFKNKFLFAKFTNTNVIVVVIKHLSSADCLQIDLASVV